MVRTAPALALGALLAAPPLAAQSESASETLRIFADAPPACVTRAAGTSSVGPVNAMFTPDGVGGGTIAIVELVDPQTAQPRASGIELTLPVICNAAHRLVISSSEGGLLRAGGRAGNRLAPDTFADLLPYGIAVDWGGTTVQAPSDSGGQLAIAQPARNGELRLRVATDAGGGALTAGRYSDTITIRFEPAS